MRDRFEKAWLPQAIFMGISYNDFWEINPKIYLIHKEAWKINVKHENFMLYVSGLYNQYSIASTVGNMFKKKGAKLVEYPKEPFDIFSEKHLVINENMTDEQKKQETLKLFEQLKNMQNAFEKHHNVKD